MTAPTPERRVGEAVELHLSGVRYAQTVHGDWLNAVYPELPVHPTTREALDKIARLTAEVERLTNQKDGAYNERDHLVAALSKFFPASLERHPAEEEWDDDWRWIVFIELPTGQVSWHIHDSEVGYFAHLARETGRKWDGHLTPEKYDRLAALSLPTPAPEATQ